MIALFFFAAVWQQLGDEANRFNTFLLGAYLIMGAIGLIYIGYLVARQRNLQQDLDLMEQLLDEEEPAGGTQVNGSLEGG